METATHTDTLVEAIRQQAAKVSNAITNRKEHPTFGYRKADILADLHRLEGLLFAFKAAVAGDNSASFQHQVWAGAADLNVDLDGLWTRAKAS